LWAEVRLSRNGIAIDIRAVFILAKGFMGWSPR
jgi:hypothetical protein